MPIEMLTSRTSSTAEFAHLEAVARSLCGYSPYLELECTSKSVHSKEAQIARGALETITNPESPDFLNFCDGNQPLVDCAFLATALLRAPTALWAPLDKRAKVNLLLALRSTRVIRPYPNNWLLFSAVIEAFFCSIGEEWDAMRIDYALRQHEQWYLGDGIYGDGPEHHLDYYNSIVIHPLLLEILWAIRGRHPEWDKMYGRVLSRAQRHAAQLERLIGPDGTFPPIGRSLTYRCGVFHLLALLAWKKLLPTEVSPARARCALLAVIGKTLQDPSNYDANGWLRIGINGDQAHLGERYISSGSSYLCSTAFLPLGLPCEDSFWCDPDEAWTQRRLWWINEPIAMDNAY